MIRIFIFLALASVCVLANGGGYHTGVEFTGSVSPFIPSGTQHVQIMNEDLEIVLNPKSADVHVHYTMKNHSDKTQKVTFGFPVEDIEKPDYLGNQEKNKKPQTGPSYCRDYQVTLNNQPLKHTYQTEKARSHEAFKNIQGWMVSTMKIKAQAVIELKISYRSDYDQKGSFVSDDSFDAAPLFRYRLSTGGVWHGPILKGKVTIKSGLGIDFEPVRIKKPVNIFKKSNDSWVWEFENLEPTLAHDFTIEVAPAVNLYNFYGKDQQIIGYQQINGKWSLIHSKYEVIASSTLPSDKQYIYNAANLTTWGDEHNRVWSEGAKGQGIGEHLNIKFVKPQRATAIQIYNGYSWGNELFKANSRLKKAELLINGKIKQHITLLDDSAAQNFKLKTSEPLKTLRMTILSTYPGDKFADTCIQRIAFITPLTKAPENYGAR